MMQQQKAANNMMMMLSTANEVNFTLALISMDFRAFYTHSSSSHDAPTTIYGESLATHCFFFACRLAPTTKIQISS
jgi:hypothetical protein